MELYEVDNEECATVVAAESYLAALEKGKKILPNVICGRRIRTQQHYRIIDDQIFALTFSNFGHFTPLSFKTYNATTEIGQIYSLYGRKQTKATLVDALSYGVDTSQMYLMKKLFHLKDEGLFVGTNGANVEAAHAMIFTYGEIIEENRNLPPSGHFTVSAVLVDKYKAEIRSRF